MTPDKFLQVGNEYIYIYLPTTFTLKHDTVTPIHKIKLIKKEPKIDNLMDAVFEINGRYYTYPIFNEEVYDHYASVGISSYIFICEPSYAKKLLMKLAYEKQESISIDKDGWADNIKACMDKLKDMA